MSVRSAEEAVTLFGETRLFYRGLLQTLRWLMGSASIVTGFFLLLLLAQGNMQNFVLEMNGRETDAAL